MTHSDSEGDPSARVQTLQVNTCAYNTTSPTVHQLLRVFGFDKPVVGRRFANRSLCAISDRQFGLSVTPARELRGKGQQPLNIVGFGFGGACRRWPQNSDLDL
jgi:hypothetical protein